VGNDKSSKKYIHVDKFLTTVKPALVTTSIKQ